MIAKSDLIILGAATAVLVFGLGQLDGRNTSTFKRASAVQKMPSAKSATNEARVFTTEALPVPTATPTSSQQGQLTGDATALSASNVTPSITLSANPPVQASDTPTRTVIMQASGQSADLLIPIDDGNELASIENQLSDNGGDLMMVHTVASGEYLNLLARRYNTTVQELQQINGLDDTVIQVGQELLYPVAQ